MGKILKFEVNLGEDYNDEDEGMDTKEENEEKGK